MKITFEKEINNCNECPFAEYVNTQGYSATECSRLPPYSTIPDEGIRYNCPFLKTGNN